MNVTKDNFLEAGRDLLKNLPNARYVAIDEEMTGIYLPGSKRPPRDHTPSQRYERLKEVAERYSIIQVGVTLFLENSEACHPQDSSPAPPALIAKTYNFSLFPAPNGGRDVTLSPSAISFLHANGMDFTVWTSKGIPHSDQRRAERALRQYGEKYDVTPSSSSSQERRRKVIVTRENDVAFVEKVVEDVTKWMGGDEATAGGSFLLPSCNRFLRRVLYETFEEKFPDLVLQKSQDDNNRIEVFNLSAEEKKSKEDANMREEWEKLLTDTLGFYAIFKALSEANRGVFSLSNSLFHKYDTNAPPSPEQKEAPAKKQKISCDKKQTRTPLIVHNGIMDILFLLTHCHAHELPTDWSEAKNIIHATFPLIYDTKIMATECCSDTFDSTTLGDLYDAIVIQGAVEEYNSNGGDVGKAHNAGYDSYMTGCLFYCLGRRLLQIKPPDNDKMDQLDEKAFIDELCYEAGGGDEGGGLWGRNRLYLMQTLFTIDLSSPKSDPYSRGVDPCMVYHVTTFDDKSIVTSDILTALDNVIPREDYDILWVNENTFVIVMTNIPMRAEKADAVMVGLKNGFKRSRVVTFEDHVKLLLSRTTDDSGAGDVLSYAGVGIVTAVTSLITQFFNSIQKLSRKRKLITL